MNLSKASIVKAGKDVLCSQLPDEESVLLNLDAGIYYGLNPVGTFAWNLLKTPISLTDIINAIVQEFQIDEATCEADLNDLLLQLLKHDLIKIVEE